jgi:hypothetical protein
MYVSLPVHTQPAVIAAQLRNFAAFFPEALVVLHVSANARFPMPQLEAAIRKRQCRNVIINPERAPTNWGGILNAHLANVAWIRRTGPASAHICLHSSNDMLVRPGVAAWLRRGRNFRNHRPIRPGSHWRFARPALLDPGLQSLCRRLGGAPVIGSQIEGSCYEAALLFEIADLIAAEDIATPAGYPREEVWLATAAHALGAEVSGCPYIFSEIHRFDRVFWQVLRYVDPLIGRPGEPRYFPRRALEYAMIKSGFHRISRTWVDRIARDAVAQLARYEVMSDGNNEWRVFDPHGLFGVKRVPRRIDSPLRAYIDRLAAATATGPASQLEQPSHEDI